MSGDFVIKYNSLIADISASECKDPFQELVEALEGEWLHYYKKMTPRVTNISGQDINGFEYVYNDYASLENTGQVPLSETIESRSFMFTEDPSHQLQDEIPRARKAG
ncbi:MAG: hypothetical protein ABL999_00965 [Pyrinomonadaceae bacterium]